MKLSFLKYLLDKIKFVFLTIFNIFLVILPKFGRHTVQRIEDTEYYKQDRDTSYIAAKPRPTTSTFASKISAEEKINKSTEQRKEEKLVQLEEKGLLKNFTKKEAVTKIKQKIEKYQEKLKDVQRDSKKQRSILKDITKCKPVKIEICHEPVKMDSAEQLRTRAILRDFPKIAAFRIEKNHEHNKEKKYREYKTQEILMNVTMSEAEKMRAAIKNYSAQQRMKREEKRQRKAAADIIRDASLSKDRQIEKISDQNKAKKNLHHRTTEFFKEVRKSKPMEIEEKFTVYCEPRKNMLREMGKDVTKYDVVKRQEKLNRGFEQGHKHTPSDFRENIKTAFTNDKSKRKRLEQYNENKYFTKNLKTCSNEVDIKKKSVKYAESPREVKQVLGGANEMVKKVCKTYGIKEKNEMVKHTAEKVEIQLQRDATMIIKDVRKQDFTKTKHMETKKDTNISHSPGIGQKQLHRAGTITIENNSTSNELEINEKKPLHRAGTINIENNSTSNELEINEKKPLQRDATVIIKTDITKTKIIETKQYRLLDSDDTNQMLTETQREDRQLIEDDTSTDELNEKICLEYELMTEKQQFRGDNNEMTKQDERTEDMDFLEKLRILDELERVEEQLLENDKILDFLTSDEDEIQEKLDELIDETVEEEMENELEICHNSDLVGQVVTAIQDVTAIKDNTTINQLEMEVENKEHQAELQKLLHRQSEEMMQELTDTEVLVLAPIIENYADKQENQKKFHHECKEKIELDTKREEMEIEHQKEEETKSKNNTTNAFTMDNTSELLQAVEQQLQETPNKSIKNISSNHELQIEEENQQPHAEQENQLKQISEEDNHAVKDVTKEILELIMECLVSEKIPVDYLKLENLEEKVKEKLGEKVGEKIINQTLATNEKLEEKQPLIDAQQMIKDCIATKDFKIEQQHSSNSQDAKQPEKGLQLQLRDIVNETNEIDEVKIVTAVVVLMTNIIERVCQQQL